MDSSDVAVRLLDSPAPVMLLLVTLLKIIFVLSVILTSECFVLIDYRFFGCQESCFRDSSYDEVLSSS